MYFCIFFRDNIRNVPNCINITSNNTIMCFSSLPPCDEIVYKLICSYSLGTLVDWGDGQDWSGRGR